MIAVCYYAFQDIYSDPLGHLPSNLSLAPVILRVVHNFTFYEGIRIMVIFVLRSKVIF